MNQCGNGVPKVTEVGLSGLCRDRDADARDLARCLARNAEKVEGQWIFMSGLKGVEVGGAGGAL